VNVWLLLRVCWCTQVRGAAVVGRVGARGRRALEPRTVRVHLEAPGHPLYDQEHQIH